MKFAILISYVLVTLVSSAFTYVLFSKDKVNAAERRYFRIPERALLFFSMLGGCFGSLLAMKLLRHKSNALTKGYFRIANYVAAVLWIVPVLFMLFS